MLFSWKSTGFLLYICKITVIIKKKRKEQEKWGGAKFPSFSKWFRRLPNRVKKEVQRDYKFKYF